MELPFRYPRCCLTESNSVDSKRLLKLVIGKRTFPCTREVEKQANSFKWLFSWAMSGEDQVSSLGVKAVAVFAALHQASLVERRQSFGWMDFCDKAAAVVQRVHEEVLKALLVWKELLPKLEPEKEVGG